MNKKNLYLIAGLVVSLNLLSLHAQPPPGRGGMGMAGSGGSPISDALAKVFGDNSSFTATLENQLKPASGGESITMPGKMAFDSGKTRFEMNMADAKGMKMPPEALEHMKTMGMDRTVMIFRSDTKMGYMIYPGLQGYAELPSQNSEAAKSADFKIETTELGKETVDGHPCVKKKVTVTDDKGAKHEYTVWSATDLKDFPVKIESTESTGASTMMFRDIKLGKPEASQFEPPSDYKKYSQGELMQEGMKRMMPGGMGGMPHGQ